MSQENVEVVREGVDAITNATPTPSSLPSPSGCMAGSGDVLPGLRGVHRGRAEAREWFKEAYLEAWEDLHLEMVETTEARDGRVFLEWVLTARGRASGVETEL